LQAPMLNSVSGGDKVFHENAGVLPGEAV
jgi:hypothetical protein